MSWKWQQRSWRMQWRHLHGLMGVGTAEFSQWAGLRWWTWKQCLQDHTKGTHSITLATLAGALSSGRMALTKLKVWVAGANMIEGTHKTFSHKSKTCKEETKMKLGTRKRLNESSNSDVPTIYHNLKKHFATKNILSTLKYFNTIYIHESLMSKYF